VKNLRTGKHLTYTVAWKSRKDADGVSQIRAEEKITPTPSKIDLLNHEGGGGRQRI